MKPLPITFFLLTSLLSCKKEVAQPCLVNVFTQVFNDTLQPSDYLMLYENSWWEYSNGKIDTCVNISFPQKDIDPDGCKRVTIDYYPTTTTPMLGTVDGDISLVNPNKLVSKTLGIPLISDQIGTIYHGYYVVGSGTMSGEKTWLVTSYGHHNSITINQVTYYDIYESKVERYTYYWHAPGGPAPEFGYHFFFAKDIGVVGYKNLYGTNPVSSDTFNLVDYYIAPH